jgi:DNA-directed RNA polymerase specialized sigma24 family protein
MDGSITLWFGYLQAGNRQAAQELWQRFARRLTVLARARLRGAPRRAADEEDAVLSAFDSFCRAAEQGRYRQLQDRSELWNLLVTITVRKVSDQIAHEQRHKRGGGAVLTEAELGGGSAGGLEDILAREPTPQLAAEMAEECQRLLDLLRDPDLRAIALFKMEGFTNQEIARKLNCARSTIQRRLDLIQARWEQEVSGTPAYAT